MVHQKKIGIVILNYNDSKTVKHLYNLIHEYQSIDHIVIVDNQSPDGSFERINSFICTKNTDVIQTDENKGYSYGNNFGANYLINKYHVDIIFISNPDVEFTEYFLRRIVIDMEKYNAQAATGFMRTPCKIVMNRRINSYWKEILNCTLLLKRLIPFHGELVRPNCGIIETEWLPGSLFAIEANVYQNVHGLDDKVFLYYEEQILGRKFQKMGYKMIVDTDIEYFHNEAVSMDKSMKKSSQWLQSNKSLYYFFTNYECIGIAKKVLMIIATEYRWLRKKVKELFRVNISL